MQKCINIKVHISFKKLKEKILMWKKNQVLHLILLHA